MKLLIHIASLLCVVFVYGQKLNSSVSKDRILIGQPIELQLSVRSEKQVKIDYQPWRGAFEGAEKIKSGNLQGSKIDFEILEEFVDTTTENKNEYEWVGRYSITAWDSGTYIIPQATIVIDDSTYLFPPLLVRIDLSAPIANQGLYDIKENFAQLPLRNSFLQWLNNNWYYLLTATLLLLALGFWIRRRLRRTEPERIKTLSLKERTLLAIDALEQEKLWEKDKLKEHFTELSYIMRSYLSNRYHLNLLEKTTFEAKLLLKNKDLHEETIKTLGLILSQSDMVKFANSKPDDSNIYRIALMARQVVAETSPIDVDNAE